MNATELQQMVRQASLDPLKSRRDLYAALSRQPTYLLHLGEQPLAPGQVRVLRGEQSFSIWADIDPELEGVWVPVFTQRKHVAAYIAGRALRPPEGREFQWMRHDPGKVYPILQSIGRFAGILLDPGADLDGVRIDWPEVNAISEGRLPPEAPVLRELPLGDYRVPEGTQYLVGELDIRLENVEGKQALFPEAGAAHRRDYRKLVRINLNEAGPAWTPCRHFIAALRMFMQRADSDEVVHLDMLVKALIDFEMYGEAEALCMRLEAQQERQAYALAVLSAIYRRSGRLNQCVEACRRGIEINPLEKAFYLDQALAHAQLEDMAAACAAARRGLRHFPQDPDLQKFL